MISRQQLRWLGNDTSGLDTAAAAAEEPPKTEEEAAVSAAEEPTTTESVETPNQVDPPSPFESFKNTAADAAESVKETVSDVSGSVSNTLGSATQSSGDSENANVYVGNLFFDVRSEDLEREFSRAGKVLSAKVISDVRGLSKG